MFHINYILMINFQYDISIYTWIEAPDERSRVTRLPSAVELSSSAWCAIFRNTSSSVARLICMSEIPSSSSLSWSSAKKSCHISEFSKIQPFSQFFEQFPISCWWLGEQWGRKENRQKWLFLVRDDERQKLIVLLFQFHIQMLSVSYQLDKHSNK